MRRIAKKAWPEYFQAVLDGVKNFELRLADFKVDSGDVLVLKEWDPETCDYTGREVKREVTYTARFKISDLANFWSKEELDEKGIQVISLK